MNDQNKEEALFNAAQELPDASFAGQQETFLNIKGVDAVLNAIKHVFVSLFNDRAILVSHVHCSRIFKYF